MVNLTIQHATVAEKVCHPRPAAYCELNVEHKLLTAIPYALERRYSLNTNIP